jgi:hypothetical protein
MSISPAASKAIRIAPCIFAGILVYGKINGVLFGGDELTKMREQMAENEKSSPLSLTGGKGVSLKGAVGAAKDKV